MGIQPCVEFVVEEGGGGEGCCCGEVIRDGESDAHVGL